MKLRLLCSAVLVAGLMSGSASAALTYSQDFELMTPAQGAAPPNDLSNDGWLNGANVYNAGGGFLYDYFAFPATNGGPAWGGVDTGQGGAAQGANQLSVYSDYNNGDHAVGNLIESFTFRDMGLLDASDVGTTYTMQYDRKQGNLASPTTATAFIKVLSQPGFGLQGIGSDDTSALGSNWSTSTVAVTIDATMIGSLLQIGFTSTATDYNPSGNFYDNINVTNVPEPGSLAALAIGSTVMVVRRRQRS